MLVAVCLKQVIARESTLRVNAAGTWVQEEDVAWVMGESDGYALEAALRLKEEYGGELLAVALGPSRVSTLLRDALARGADRAIHIVDDSIASRVDPQAIAAGLAQCLSDERPDLVLTGLQSDDLGFAQVGVLLAEALDASHATLATAIEIHDRSARVKRELEAGWMQWVTVPLPSVITVQSGAHPLRFATLRGLMAAKKKDIRTVPVVVDREARQRVLAVSTPNRQKQTQIIEGPLEEAAATLARVLRGGHV